MLHNNRDKVNRHIAFISDDNYVLPTCVAIKSLVVNVCNDNNYHYIIHVFSFGLSGESQKRLNAISNGTSLIIVHCIDKNLYEKSFLSINQKTHVTPTALLKFDLPNLLPEVDELLYLDGDIIINGDITSIYDYDINGFSLAASFEFWTYLMKIYEFDGDNEVPSFSFNSGVMLLNLRYFRDHGIAKQLWKVKYVQCNQNDKKENMMDQTTFNIVCSNSCVHLPIRYNCNNQFTEGVDVSLINKVYGTSYRMSNDVKEDAVIIHYVGKKDKPWLYQGMRCQEIWDTYCVSLGVNIEELNRRKFKKTFRYYIIRLKRSLEVRGLKKTMSYLLYKRKIKL